MMSKKQKRKFGVYFALNNKLNHKLVRETAYEIDANNEEELIVELEKRLCNNNG